jgi:hypothetical protein
LKASAPYVAARVTNMSGVDLDVFDFDRSLTFAALIMNADGTVYHRYGSGDGRDSSAKVSETSFLKLLRGALESHAAYEKGPTPVLGRKKRTIEDLAPMQRRFAAGRKRSECVHCHTVADLEREQATEEGRWRRDDVWRHPAAERIGLTLDRDDQEAIVAVAAGSAAEKAGLAAGDRLVRVSGRRVRTEADVRHALDQAPWGEAALEVEVARGGEPRKASIILVEGWKRGDAVELSWRNDVWEMRPNPGFGGAALTKDEKAKLGLAADAFTLRIDYLIDFGPHPEDGRNAKAAGLRKGDVVLAVDGCSDFIHHRHFQAWWRLTREPGKTAILDVLSGSERKKIALPILP